MRINLADDPKKRRKRKRKVGKLDPGLLDQLGED